MKWTAPNQDLFALVETLNPGDEIIFGGKLPQYPYSNRVYLAVVLKGTRYSLPLLLEASRLATGTHFVYPERILVDPWTIRWLYVIRRKS